MDKDIFEDFIITQEDLAEIENIEITLLSKSFTLAEDDDDDDFNIVTSQKRKRRLILLSESEESDSENRVIPDISGK